MQDFNTGMIEILGGAEKVVCATNTDINPASYTKKEVTKMKAGHLTECGGRGALIREQTKDMTPYESEAWAIEHGQFAEDGTPTAIYKEELGLSNAEMLAILPTVKGMQ